MFRELLVWLALKLAPKEMNELNLWRTKSIEYRRWLSEFPDIRMAMDNMMAEINQIEHINVSYPPDNTGPWDVAGLREKLRDQHNTLAGKNDPQADIVRVVCAASKLIDGTVILGVRHGDKLMKNTSELMYIDEHIYSGGRVFMTRGQWADSQVVGFIGSRGEFLTRREAWVVAAKAKQIIRYLGEQTERDLTRSDVELFTENLY
jgi:hypothetical protein